MAGTSRGRLSSISWAAGILTAMPAMSEPSWALPCGLVGIPQHYREPIRYHSPIRNHGVPEYSGSPFIRFRTWRVWASQLMGWMCLRVILIWASQMISCMTSRFQVQRMICAFPTQSISHLSIQIIWLFSESVRICFKFKPAVFLNMIYFFKIEKSA